MADFGRWGWVNTAHKWLNVPDDSCARYNLHDVYWTARLLKPLLDDAADLDQLQWWIEFGEPFQYAVLDMQRRGLLVDLAALKDYTAKVRAELTACDTRIRAAADAAGFTYTDKFPNSRDQVSAFLFDALKLKAAKRTGKKQRGSVDQDALTRVLRDLRKMDEPHRHTLYDLFHRTRLATILSRYVKLTPDPDGRLRPVIKSNHVKTGRLAYANPALQQFPEEARHVVVAAPGKVFVCADHSQLEARLLSYYCNDLPAIKVFEDGGDPHAANAMDLFNLTSEQWAAQENPDPARNYAKTWLYRRMYGGTAASGDKKLFCPCPKCAAKMPSTLALRPSEAAAAEERYDARHPAVKLWQRTTAAEVRVTHRFPLLLGGYRYLSSPWSSDLDRELKNLPMQSGGARVMIRSQVELFRRGVPIVLQHHDSFMVECDEAAVGATVDTLREVMETPVRIGTRDVALPVDIKVGRNWGRYHKNTNPHGLRKL